MHIRFTKMQGVGNDFVVLDATQTPLSLSTEQLIRLGDRRFGVGADQILIVERTATPGVDFRYRIFNGANGEEVEHCGNGARCFVRYVVDKGLSDKTTLRVETMNNLLVLKLQADGRVTVDMNRPVFDLPRIPFNAADLQPRQVHGFALWPLDVHGEIVEIAPVSVGNPHAVQVVSDVDSAPVATQGPVIERHPRFPQGVNAGFMQVVSRSHIRLRVHERGAGETLACGTGACAAVVAGIRMGLLDHRVDVDARGGRLVVEWTNEGSLAEAEQVPPVTEGEGPGDNSGHVFMTGPAQTVFEGDIEL